MAAAKVAAEAKLEAEQLPTREKVRAAACVAPPLRADRCQSLLFLTRACQVAERLDVLKSLFDEGFVSDSLARQRQAQLLATLDHLHLQGGAGEMGYDF